MASGIEELVNMLYDMISDAWGLPFGAEKCLLERDKVLDLIDEIRANLPKDLEQARIIVENRNEIISQAKREAESIKRAAEEKARQMVAEDEIVVTSRQKSNEMVTAAENKAREIRRAANEYVDDTLKRLEEVMAQALSEMRNSRQQFKNVVNKNK
jgi:cell division septum initiation protein DivIVA